MVKEMLLCTPSGMFWLKLSLLFPTTLSLMNGLHPLMFLEGAIKTHQVAVDAHGKSMIPKDSWQIMNNDIRQYYV
jgi:hypothetical protein